MSNDFYDDEDLEQQEEQVKPDRMKKRREFITLSKKGNKIITKGMILQFGKKTANENSLSDAESFLPDQPRIGYTASKSVGKSVYRNRARRRMREATREVFKQHPRLFKKDHSYNFIARYSTIERPFESLVKDIKYALHNVTENK
ncbi:MAG TPA: ribonuclease P protein component [Alphaproteobacteria bacterium]|nr:ribonuclease P protein component [Alphaproteobacteria bacterium]